MTKTLVGTPDPEEPSDPGYTQRIDVDVDGCATWYFHPQQGWVRSLAGVWNPSTVNMTIEVRRL